MYVIKFAVKNIFRNKGRSILLGILLFILLAGISIAMVIEAAAQKVSNNYKEQVNVSAVLKVDYMSLITSSVDGIIDAAGLTLEDYQHYANSEYVKAFYSYGSVPVFTPEITAVGSVIEMGYGVQSSDQIDEGNLMVYGYSDLSQLTDFIEGNRKITSGQVFSQLNECIISSELAEQNGLEVGDTISVRTVVKATQQNLELKIAGIYLDVTPSEGSYYVTYQNPRNDVIVSMETLEQLENGTYDIEGSFILSDPTKVNEFTEELTRKGLPDGYYVSADTETYDQVFAPAEGLSQTVKVFLIVIFVLGGGILLLLSLLMIRERKYEIGVLSARGMTKSLIALQFIMENMVLAAICLILAMSLSSVLAQPIADSLLESQMEAAEENQESNQSQLQNAFNVAEYSSTSFGSGSSDISAISEIRVSFGAGEILRIVLMTLLLSILSSLAAVVYITKHEPMKILSERS